MNLFTFIIQFLFNPNMFCWSNSYVESPIAKIKHFYKKIIWKGVKIFCCYKKVASGLFLICFYFDQSFIILLHRNFFFISTIFIITAKANIFWAYVQFCVLDGTEWIIEKFKTLLVNEANVHCSKQQALALIDFKKILQPEKNCKKSRREI